MKPEISVSQIANTIIQRATISGEQIHSFVPVEDRPSLAHKYILVMEELRDEGIIEIYTNVPHKPLYKLTRKGIALKESGQTYDDYLKKEAEEKQKQAVKENRDDEIKTFQHEDLKRKVTEMNQAQLDFWKSQKQKNVQTTIIALISATFSLIAMLKSFGFL